MENNKNDIELDLKSLIRALMNRWYILVSLSVLGGLVCFGILQLQTPKYKASAKIYFNTDAFFIPIESIDFIGSDDIRDYMKEVLEIETSGLPSVEVDALGKNIFMVSVQNENSDQLVSYVNNWVDSTILYAYESNDFLNANVEEKKEAVEIADKEFIEYLDNNNLMGYYWSDLVLLTGYGMQTANMVSIYNMELYNADEGVTDIISNTSTLGFYRNRAVITETQYLSILELMRERVEAEQQYNSAKIIVENINNNLQYDYPRVINYAKSVSQVGKFNTFLMILLGLIGGFLSGSVIIIFSLWWKEDQTINQDFQD